MKVRWKLSRHLATYLLTAVLATTVGSSAQGEIISFSMANTTAGVTQTTYNAVDYDGDSSGDVWNNIGRTAADETAAGVVQDLQGNDTAVTISWAGSQGQNPNEGGGADPTAWANALGVEHAGGSNSTMHSLFWDGGSFSVTIGGLDAGSLWDVEIFSATSFANTGSGVQFSINVSPTQNIVLEAFASSSDPEDARTLFSNLAADGSGDLVINASASAETGWGPGIYALRITRVPEPTSVVILGATLLAGFALRRR